MKKKPDLKERVQDEIKKLIDEIDKKQYGRAGVIENALKVYEKRISLNAKTVRDYVELIKTQRLLVGLDTENMRIGGFVGVTTISTEERQELKEIAHEIAQRKTIRK